MRKEMVCQVCGGRLDEIGGYYVCSCCEAKFEKEAAYDDSEFVDAVYEAERYLDMSPVNFDRAEDLFSLVVKRYSSSSVGYWGRARAKFGIKFETDFDGKRVPSCYKAVYKDIRNDPDYHSAIKNAENEELKKSYISVAEKIAETARVWRETASKYDYDVFICFKATDENDGGRETRDSREMQNLYTYLTENGYKVFFSPVSLNKAGIYGEKSEPYIFNALEKAKAMIVFGSDAAYFKSTWMQNEWSRYLRLISDGSKKVGSLLVACDGVSPESLPRQLRSLQAIKADTKHFFGDILDKLSTIIPKKQWDKKKKSWNGEAFTKKKSSAVLAVIMLFIVCIVGTTIASAAFSDGFLGSARSAPAPIVEASGEPSPSMSPESSPSLALKEYDYTFTASIDEGVKSLEVYTNTLNSAKKRYLSDGDGINEDDRLYYTIRLNDGYRMTECIETTDSVFEKWRFAQNDLGREDIIFVKGDIDITICTEKYTADDVEEIDEVILGRTDDLPFDVDGDTISLGNYYARTLDDDGEMLVGVLHYEISDTKYGFTGYGNLFATDNTQRYAVVGINSNSIGRYVKIDIVAVNGYTHIKKPFSKVYKIVE